MEREMFKLGAEQLEFKGGKYPLIDESLAIINNYKESVKLIETEFSASVDQARKRAEKQYNEVCEETISFLKIIT